MLQQCTRQDPVRTDEPWLLSSASGIQTGLPTVTQQVFDSNSKLGFFLKKRASHYFRVMRLKISRGRDFPGSPVVKTLPSNAGDVGSIPAWGDKIPHASGAKKPKQRQCCDKFSKDLKKKRYQEETALLWRWLQWERYLPLVVQNF